jgi:protein phosphatase
MTNWSEQETAELPAPVLDAPRPPSAAVVVDLAARSHPGKVRTNNEDHYLVVRFGRSMETLLSNLPEGAVPARCDEVGYGVAVADGMGGRHAGEVASRMVIEALLTAVLQTPDWIVRPEGAFAELAMIRAADRHRRLQSVLVHEAEANPELQGMGTTLTVAWSVGVDLFVAHVGDSRIYLFREGRLCQLTTDHTLAQEMANEGRIAPDQVARHRLRHVLTRAITTEGHDVEPEVQRLRLADRDCILACTDGLTDMVAEDEIVHVLAESATADESAQRLVELALEHGGRDNVTTVVARYAIPSEAEPPGHCGH